LFSQIRLDQNNKKQNLRWIRSGQTVKNISTISAQWRSLHTVESELNSLFIVYFYKNEQLLYGGREKQHETAMDWLAFKAQNMVGPSWNKSRFLGCQTLVNKCLVTEETWSNHTVKHSVFSIEYDDDFDSPLLWYTNYFNNCANQIFLIISSFFTM